MVMKVSNVLETNLCKINYSESLKELAEATIQLLEGKIIEYKLFFDISTNELLIKKSSAIF